MLFPAANHNRFYLKRVINEFIKHIFVKSP